ncbi:Fe(3+)-siderophore ABC transporter permease [Nakamurella silvestris]|nr:Fe(3+)-siderophore ABC transporter permease [Nakamurella silvestris]
MSTAPPADPDRRHNTRRVGLLVLAAVVLLVLMLISIAVGSKSISLGTVITEILHPTDSEDGIIIRSSRLPRTLLGLAVGIALGAAGALMQSLTRNPLADPGILGVNAGASVAVVGSISLFGLTDPSAYVWFALFGAAVASVLVYVLGSGGRAAATPVRLALAGAAISAALGAVVSGIVLLDRAAFDQFRFWSVGSLAGRPLEVLTELLPFLAAGSVIAVALARPLNALALGEDAGRALGASPTRTRVLGVLAVTLLCGASVAAVGPIGFVGLTVPHIARGITGPDQRWVIPYSMVLAPVLLLASDILGRIIARPHEIEVGIVTALVGAPVFILIARRNRMAAL